MNPARYLVIALGASMCLCAPAMASPVVTIDDTTDTLSVADTGWTTVTGPVVVGETATFIGTYTSTLPLPLEIFGNIIGPGETLSDTLSIVLEATPTSENGNAQATVTFISDTEGGAALTRLSCTGGDTPCITFTGPESGSFILLNDAMTAELTVSWASDVEVPLPGTLPLFASGLGVLGLLGWRRKRKAQAAA